jgi:Tfp pilus assembly protein PilX
MEMTMTSFNGHRRQRGISTLAITMLLLLILSVVVLFSTSVGFFEQRTAVNENRARIAEQAAETGINMAGEYIKASRALIISNAANGWLDSTAGGNGWVSCNGVSNTATIGGRAHPCRSEPNATRRNQLWFFTTDGTGASLATTYLPYGAVGNVGGTAAFPSVVNVQAVLCRIDSSLTTPACTQNPARGNRVAITFISQATLTNEGSTAVIKETWASYTDASQSSSVPVIGSGFVKGLGNAQIVTNPNAGGYGVPASIWSPNDVGISGPATGCGTSNGGVGSFSSCQVGEYLQGNPLSALKTTCVTANNACGCPAISGSENNFLSGHSAGTKREGIDILDIDGGQGSLPDVTFFPGLDCAGNNKSDLSDNTDDSLFEWVFNSGVVVDEGAGTVNTNCGSGGATNCASYVLEEELGAQVVSCATLNTLGAAASGLYYIKGTCDLPGQVGSPNNPAIVVLEGEAKVNNTDFFGLLFVRSNNNSAVFKGVGNSKIIGSLVVEGNIDIAGTIDIIYDNTAVNSDPNTLPSNAKFARVPGSWLDATEGF